jgi:hypothetical protein
MADPVVTISVPQPTNAITITATITWGELYYSMADSFDGSIGLAADTINDVEATMTMTSTGIAQDLGANLGLSVAWALAGGDVIGGTLATTIVLCMLGMMFVGLVKVVLTVVSYLWRLVKFW